MLPSEADPLSGTAPLEVDFEAGGPTDEDGTIESYVWDFGDGSTGTRTTMAHTFTTAGSYTVSVTVDGDGGTDTASRTINATSDGDNDAPTAVDDVATADTATRLPSVTVNVAANDHDPDGNLDFSSVTVKRVRGPGVGLANDDGTIRYLPLIGFTATSVISYQICDTEGLCDKAAVTISGELRGCTIRGTEGRDVLIGTPGDDVICGFGGHVILREKGGDDPLIGDDGNDFLDGGNGDDILIGGPGRNLLSGGSGTDRCSEASFSIGCARGRGSKVGLAWLEDGREAKRKRQLPIWGTTSRASGGLEAHGED